MAGCKHVRCLLGGGGTCSACRWRAVFDSDYEEIRFFHHVGGCGRWVGLGEGVKIVCRRGKTCNKSALKANKLRLLEPAGGWMFTSDYLDSSLQTKLVERALLRAALGFLDVFVLKRQEPDQ